MLDEGDDPAGHEARRPHGCAGPGDLAHLDDPPAGADFHPAPGPRRRYLVGPGPVAGIDHDLHPVPLHRGTRPLRTPVTASSPGWNAPSMTYHPCATETPSCLIPLAGIPQAEVHDPVNSAPHRSAKSSRYEKSSRQCGRKLVHLYR